MKPVYLEFCGLNSFEDKAQIDFSKLLAGGVFGIFGDTGSGKSTILDSIHFALYGEIDRAPKSFNECINHRSDGAYVTFDFEIATDGVRRTYRVKRERRRKSGTTKAYLYERTQSGELLAVAEGTREVDEKIENIIGLTFSDFKTCIALPQGDFAALVKSTAAERVKLVARLFNLEKYGERLSRAVNERYAKAEEEVGLISAKMEENEGGDEQLFERTKAEVSEEKTLAETAKKTLAVLEERLQKLLSAQKEKQSFDALCNRLNVLQARSSEMQEKRALLEKYPKAQAVKEKSDEYLETGKQKTLAATRLQTAKSAYETSLTQQKKIKAYLEEARFEERILQLSLRLQKVKESAQDCAHAERLKKEYDACVAQYREIKDKYPSEAFAEKKAKIEDEIEALGEDNNLLDYLKRNYKGVLLADTYGEICADLLNLANKHPAVEADVQELLQKYTLQTVDGQTVDIVAINLSFKEKEQLRKRLQTELSALEDRRQKYEQNEAQKQLVVQHGNLLKQNLQLALDKVADVQGLGTEKELSAKLSALKKEQTETQLSLERAQEKANGYFTETQTQEQMIALYAERENTLFTALNEILKANGFTDEAQAFSLIDRVGDCVRMQREVNAFFEEYELCRRRVEETDKTPFESFDETVLQKTVRERDTAKETYDALTRSLNFKEAKLERLTALKEKYKEQAKVLAEKRKNLQVCDELRQLLRGNKFLEFIASEYLQEVCLSASKTLLSLTGGRYFLQYDKEFKVGDNRDGGNLRAVKTLSGGETFLVSLSLALSLSASICQKSRRPIEFFFLDEGFGTLDEKLVETVMDVLGKLSKSFSVGLISHVEELKRRIENKILVTGATELKGSTLKVETY
ncbi:MAG: SMC family ATPase [Clostridia bacterium]|nr:SMC family ATPase [Clostridia bacterium]